MAERPQPLGPWPFAGVGAALLLAALTLGTLAIVAFHADTPARLAGHDWAALRFTVSQALVSAGLSIAFAVPVARALARRQFRGRRLLVTLLGAPFLLPVIVAVLGLLAVYGRSGLVSDLLAWLGIAPLEIYGFRGVVLAHVFFNLPLATRLILQGWQAIPAEHFRLAAQLDLSPRALSRHLEWPMLRAVLPGIFATIFLLCVTSFAVALTLGGGPRATTLELAIYQAFRYDFDLSRAAFLALMQFGLGGVAALLAWRLAAPMRLGPGFDQPVRRWDSQGWLARLIDAVALGLVTLFLLTPLLMVVIKGLGGLADLSLAQADVLAGSAIRSVLVALVSAGLTLGLGLAMAQAISSLRGGGQRARLAALVEASGYLTLAASSMVVGTGVFILLFPLIDPARLALPVTAMVNAAMALPFALRAMLPAVRAVDQDYGALADSLGMVGWARFRLLTWPRVRAEAGFATGLAAALSMGDLGVIALFADPEAATLPLMLYRLMGSYQMGAANAAAMLLVGLSLALFWLFDQGGRRHAGA